MTVENLSFSAISISMFCLFFNTKLFGTEYDKIDTLLVSSQPRDPTDMIPTGIIKLRGFSTAQIQEFVPTYIQNLCSGASPPASNFQQNAPALATLIIPQANENTPMHSPVLPLVPGSFSPLPVSITNEQSIAPAIDISFDTIDPLEITNAFSSSSSVSLDFMFSP